MIRPRPEILYSPQLKLGSPVDIREKIAAVVKRSSNLRRDKMGPWDMGHSGTLRDTLQARSREEMASAMVTFVTVGLPPPFASLAQPPVQKMSVIKKTRDAVSDYLSPDDRMEALKNITDLLSRTFSSQFVFPVLGHADPQEPEKLGQLWRQWLPTDALQTFNT
ncbi:unnamed protein product, partial [Nesidiocoris tenuis]